MKNTLVCVAALAAVAGCSTTANKTYCDESHACTDPALPICMLATKTCVANPGFDLAGVDGDVIIPGDEGIPHDLAEPDLAEPDLHPMCTVAADCTAPGKPLCGAGNVCRACTGDTDDAACAARSGATPYCASGSGACVACRTSQHCQSSVATTTPVCETTGDGANTCRGCKAHSECASLVCNSDGSCQDAGTIIYVSQTGGTGDPCTGTTHAGTLADPYCQVGDGIAATTGTKKVVRIIGAANPYDSVALVNLPTTGVRVVGPGSTDAKTAVVYGSGTAIMLSFKPTSGDQSISFDGVVFGTSSDPTTKIGLQCDGSAANSASLTLRDVIVQRAGSNGIDLKSCVVTMSHVTVSGSQGIGMSAVDGSLTANGIVVTANTSGGVAVSGTATYALSNVLAYRNGTNGGSEFGGVRLDSNNGFLANATVYANLSKSARAAGVRCADPDPIVLNTVIMDSIGGTDTAAGCTFQSSAYKSASASRDLTSCAAADLFNDPDNNNYHVKIGGSAPCSLVGGGAATYMTATAPIADYDGIARPGLAGYDIGAYESQ